MMKILLLMVTLCRADVVEPSQPPSAPPARSAALALGLGLAAAGVLGAYLSRRRA